MRALRGINGFLQRVRQRAGSLWQRPRISPPVLPLIFGVILFCAHVIINTSARSSQVFTPFPSTEIPLTTICKYLLARQHGDYERGNKRRQGFVDRDSSIGIRRQGFVDRDSSQTIAPQFNPLTRRTSTKIPNTSTIHISSIHKSCNFSSTRTDKNLQISISKLTNVCLTENWRKVKLFLEKKNCFNPLHSTSERTSYLNFSQQLSLIITNVYIQFCTMRCTRRIE